jgi:hypothetical protein
MKETNWMENERVRRIIDNLSYYDIDMADYELLCNTVAEEAVKDNRKWISVDETMIDLVDKVFDSPKNPADLSDMTHRRYSEYHRSVRDKFQIKHAFWSMDQIDLERVEGLKLIAENIDFSKVKWMRTLDSSVSIPAEGIKVAADIMILFDDLIQETGDKHHVFMEGMRFEGEDVLVIHTGS